MKIIILALLFCTTSALAMPNFKDYPAGAKRNLEFFSYLRPFIQRVNSKILAERRKLKSLYRVKFIQQKNLTPKQLAWVKHLSFKYRMTISDKKNSWNNLLRRVDIVPTSLALAQAANETAYGTTRFAQHGNNFYGTWCYKKGCGFVPRRRDKGKTHEVKRYVSVTASISHYMRNLNTNAHYKILRDLRAQERNYGKLPSGVILASGLLAYSQLQETYVEALQKIIIRNQLEKTIDYN